MLRAAPYFALLLAALGTALARYPWLAGGPCGRALRWGHAAAAAGALAVTWFLIFSFFAAEGAAAGCAWPWFPFTCETQAWAETPSVFVRAYEMVADSPAGWVWSSQLLAWVVPGCVFLAVESRRRGGALAHAWAFIALGFLGAISCAFWLFFGHLSAAGAPRFDRKSAPTARLLPWLRASSLLGAASIVALPLTREGPAFVAALAALHLALPVPVAALHWHGSAAATLDVDRPSRGLAGLYAQLALFGLAAHVGALLAAAAPPGELWGALLWHNVCQASIGLDGVFTSAVTVLWLLRQRSGAALACAAAVPLASAAAVFPAYLALREWQWAGGVLGWG